MSNEPSPADALYTAVKFGQLETVQTAIRETPELIKGKPVINGAWSNGGRRCASQDDVLSCVWLLIQAGARFETLGPEDLDSVFKAFPRIAKLLVAHGANAQVADGAGRTILHYMVEIRNCSAAKVLLENGADINAKAADGETPLDVAVKQNLPEMVRFLRRRGAISNVTSLDDDPPRPSHRRLRLGEGRFKGDVCWYRADRGYGYLRDERRVYGELFFDRDDIVGEEPDAIEEGTPLSFEVAHDKYGLYAVNVDFGKSRQERNRLIAEEKECALPFVAEFSESALSTNWRIDDAPTVNDGVLRFAPDRNPQLVTTDTGFADFSLAVDVRIVAEDAGIIVRWISPDEYYMVQVAVPKPHEGECESDNVAWFHVFSPEHRGWRRDDLPGGERPVENQWYRLRLKALGFELTLSLHELDDAGNTGRALIDTLRWSDRDEMFPRGAIGFWECPNDCEGMPGEIGEFRNLVVSPL